MITATNPDNSPANSLTFRVVGCVGKRNCPTIAVSGGITPASVAASSTPPLVTITGTNYQAGASVRWNGLPRAATYMSSTQIQVQLTTADVTSAGTATVIVVNADGGVSNAGTFTVQ